MGKFWVKAAPAVVGAVVGVLVVGAVTVAQQERAVRKGPATPVVVVGSEPVSVTGEVSATLDEPVEVVTGAEELAVDVSSLEARLDEINASIEAQAAQEPGVYRSTVCSGAIGPGDTERCFIGAEIATGGIITYEDVLVSSATINSSNDEMIVWAQESSGPVVVVANSFANNLPPVVHHTYPTPMIAQSLVVFCENESEDCEYSISVIGHGLGRVL